MKQIDKLLNSLTMYRVVLYALIIIVAASFGLSAINKLGFGLIPLAVSLVILLVSGAISHFALSKVFRAATGTESWLISVIILFLVLKPAQNSADYAVLIIAAVLATASKYVLTYANRHIFNPVAIALLVLDIFGSGQIFWWVGSKVLLPVVLVVGLLVVRKIRRFDILVPFVIVASVSYVLSRGISAGTFSLLAGMYLSGPIIFFATFMLTEPQTSPHRHNFRFAYGVIVGLLFGVSFEFRYLFSSPELALIVGNLFTFAVSSKRAYSLYFRFYTQPSPGVYEFSFISNNKIPFTAGQYMEWTFPHKHTDSRGDRRYLTIASSPSESDVKFVVRIDPVNSSSFKRSLLNLQTGDRVWASQLSGDFILPSDPAAKIALIAGGIGITPFRSAIKQLIDANQTCDITLFYTSGTGGGFTYWPLFDEAMRIGLRPVYIITGKDIPQGWIGKTGYLTAEIVKEAIPDYKNTHFYVSGPDVMVNSYKKMLRNAGIPKKHIKSDYFAGY